MNMFARFKSQLRFFRSFLSIVWGLFRIFRHSSKDTVLRLMLIDSFLNFVKGLEQPLVETKTTGDSLALYQQYDDREQREYESGALTIAMQNGISVEKTDKEMRAHHLSYLYSQLDDVFACNGDQKIKVLEVGCGNCLNIVAISERYGDKVEICGIDISDERIKVAAKYFGSRLDNAKLQVASITQRTSFEDKSFDVVFSMFCVEQIAYETKAAIQEMYRIASKKLVLIEPVYENGTFMQKLGLIHADHVRILLKVVKELNLPLRVNQILDIQFNPNNQSSILVIDRNVSS